MGTVNIGYNSDKENPIHRQLDEISRFLYRLGQETAGDPDPATYEELERFTPAELGVEHPTTLLKAGRLIYLAADALGEALRALDSTQPQSTNSNNIAVLASQYGPQGEQL